MHRIADSILEHKKRILIISIILVVVSAALMP